MQYHIQFGSSDETALLKSCKLIVWDEATMSHKGSLEALDATMEDLRSSNNVLGGVTLLLAGDRYYLLY